MSRRNERARFAARGGQFRARCSSRRRRCNGSGCSGPVATTRGGIEWDFSEGRVVGRSLAGSPAASFTTEAARWRKSGDLGTPRRTPPRALAVAARDLRAVPRENPDDPRPIHRPRIAERREATTENIAREVDNPENGVPANERDDRRFERAIRVRKVKWV